MSTTTKAAHTPGPWTLEEHDDEPCRLLGGTIHIGDLYMTDFPVAKADADLIAAAPELETALNAAPEMDSWALMTPEEREETIGGYLIWYHNQRKAAIQKARGGQ
jgi:hypothetical protein